MALSSMSVSANTIATTPLPITEAEENSVMPLTEEVKWYYRYNDNGVLQKRLWSLTNGYWLTDWIDCE